MLRVGCWRQDATGQNRKQIGPAARRFRNLFATTPASAAKPNQVERRALQVYASIEWVSFRCLMSSFPYLCHMRIFTCMSLACLSGPAMQIPGLITAVISEFGWDFKAQSHVSFHRGDSCQTYHGLLQRAQDHQVCIVV